MTKSQDAAIPKEAKRKVGRPSKGRRANFTFRLTNALREKLASAAEASDLSMSEEIERRLDQSFSGAGIVAEMFGGPEIARLMNVFALAALTVELQTGRKFSEDEVTNLAMKEAFKDIIELIKTPPADPSQPPMSLTNLGKYVDSFGIGRDAATRAVNIARNSVAKAESESQAKSNEEKGGNK
jgi:hypothetical protein